MEESHESLSLHSPLTDHVYPTSPVPPRRKSVTFSNDTYEPADVGTTVENTRPSSPTSADTQPSIPHAISEEPNGDKSDSANFHENTLGNLIREELLNLHDENLKSFLPRDRLDEILTEETIKRTLEEEAKFPKEQLKVIVQEILSPSTSNQNAQPYLRSRKEILVILSLIDRVSTIERFIKEDICDYDLPFRYVRETKPQSGDQRRWVMKTSDLERDPRPILLFSEWRHYQAESFEDQQWRVHVPVFSLSREGICEPTHYSMAQKAITPYLSRKGVGRGGFSFVDKVEIHHGHIDPKGSKTVFAIKRLGTSTKSMFEQEVSALSRFADKEHPHLIRLLWTFSLGSTYHLVFPCADGNLIGLWKEHKSPLARKKDHSIAMWFARQCLGIVEGLKLIHQDTDHNSDEPKRHGRHGDLKPENILWFRDFNSSKEGYSLGTLKISDFGLARFHRTNSKSQINTEGIRGSPTYRAPEYDVHNEVSQSYDIWSLACVLLEFVTWYLKGWDEVENFSKSRKDEDRNSVIREDIFFSCTQHRNTISAKAKKTVADEVQSLYEHVDGSDFTLELVQLIQERLLRMLPDERIKCRDAYEQLKKIFDDCCKYPEFCLKRIKAPPAMRSTEISLLGPVELPRTVWPKSWSDDISPKTATRRGSGSMTPRSSPGSTPSERPPYIREATLFEETPSQSDEPTDGDADQNKLLPRVELPLNMPLNKPVVKSGEHIHGHTIHQDNAQTQDSNTARNTIYNRFIDGGLLQDKEQGQDIQRLDVPKSQPEKGSSQRGSNFQHNLDKPEKDNPAMGFKLEGPPNIYGHSVDPLTVLETLTSQPAIGQPISTVESCIQQYHGDALHSIRQKTSVSLRRYFPHRKGENTILCAAFNVDWDLRNFLIENYPQGIYQKLGKIIAITGTVDTARLCSVSQYFKWCWHHESSQLLKALEQAIMDSSSTSSPSCKWLNPSSVSISSLPSKNRIHIDASLRTVNVMGPEDFTITIAQQLSWLTAAFHEKKDSLTYAYVGFCEAPQPAADLGTPTFNIEVQFEVLPQNENSKMCWNSVIGPGVIIRGFPLPERKHKERGLEVSIRVMAQLLDLHKAVTFKGGYVFKGRHTALIPVQTFRNSIQWHIVDVYPRKLEWTDIDALCPVRLIRYAKAGFFLDTRSFIGWCPIVLDTLATRNYEYDLVSYSQACKPHRWAQVDKLQLGFSQWGTITAEVSVGKKDGYRCQRPDDYDALLEDAKNTHIILYDTAQRRATQTNAEDLILHVLHHRRNKKSKDTHADASYQGQDIDFAHPDRRVTPTRKVMLSNAERVFCYRRPFSSPELEPSLFKYEFKSIYATIDGLWAQDYVNKKSHVMDLSLNLKPNVSGWEYMDLVEPSRWMSPKSMNLRSKCGRWNEYARDIQALVLFGSGFGDILSAASPPNVCSALASVPKGHFCLGIRVDTLERLFTLQGSFGDQMRLTANGLTLTGSKDLFKVSDGKAGPPCGPRRLVHFIKPGLTKGEHTSLPLEANGAIIIGDFEDSILHKDCIQKRSGDTSRRGPKWLRLDYYTSFIPMKPRPTTYQADY